MSERTQKLVSIRRRTDHDLLVLVNRELDRGLTLVHMATSTYSPFFAQAEKAWGMACGLSARISDWQDADRRHIESRQAELRLRLDGVPAVVTLASYAS